MALDCLKPGYERHRAALPVLTTSRSLRSGSRAMPFSLRLEPIQHHNAG